MVCATGIPFGCGIAANVLGLNLTACNNVILVDMWWNPALEVSFHCFMSPMLIGVSALAVPSGSQLLLFRQTLFLSAVNDWM